jgi:hypothetical protein
VTFDALFEPDPKSIAGLAEIVPRFSLLVEDLAHLSNEDLKGRALAAFPKLALWVLRDARDTEQLLGNLSHWATAFREALRTPNGMQALAQLMRYIALVSDELHFEQFRAKIREQVPEAEEAAMTIAEQMRREGREEGRLETLRGTLHKLVLLKFGEPTNEYKQRIEAASIEELDSYVERVLTAKTVDALFDR